MSDQQTTSRPANTPEQGKRWPYSPGHYVVRLTWTIARFTIWKLAWKRVPLLRSLILRVFGTQTPLVNEFDGSARVEMPWQLKLGRFVTIGPRVHLYNLGPMSIGSRVVISQDAYLCGGSHDYNSPTFELIRSRIEVGDDVWIAAGAFIGPGVTIGQGSIVGARAVVTRDVAPWTVVAGNPAVEIKKRQLRSPDRP